MLFHTINTKYVKPSLVCDIETLEVCDNHWRSFKNIIEIGEELELLLYKGKTFLDVEKELIEFCLILNKQNPRIETLKFFINPTGKATFICLCISDVTEFKPENFLKRNIIYDFRKQNKRLMFTDITKNEWTGVNNIHSDKQLPLEWHANEKLTTKYEKYKNLFL